MDVYINGPQERKESKELLLRIRDSVPKRFHIVNPNLEVDLYLAEKADVLILRTDHYDDSTWATIGMARAGKRVVIPYWNATYSPVNRGFWADVHGTSNKDLICNRYLVRDKNDKRNWPVEDIKDIFKDLRSLEHKSKWRKIRKEKPGKESVNLDLPWYIVGDSRGLENAWIFFEIEKCFNEAGIECLIPPKAIDGCYNINEYPRRINMNASNDSIQVCEDLSSSRSGGLIGRSDPKFLLGSNWEKGVAWFNSKPILDLYMYLFPPRDPYQSYLDRKKLSNFAASVYRQNEELWGIRKHSDETPEGLAGVILTARNKNKKMLPKNGKN